MNVLNYQFLIYLLVVEMIQIPYIYTYNYVNLLRLFTFTFDLKLLFFNKSVRLFTRDNIFRVINNEGTASKWRTNCITRLFVVNGNEKAEAEAESDHKQ